MLKNPPCILNKPSYSIFSHDHPKKSFNYQSFNQTFLKKNHILKKSKISADDGLIYEIKTLFRHILANIIIRLKQVDINHFATFKLNTVLFNHINDFYFCHADYLNSSSTDLQTLTKSQRIALQHELLKHIINRNDLNTESGSSGHIALNSRQHELAYLRQISKRILPLLLPNHVLKCRMSMELIEEIFVNKLLLKGLDIIAEPDSINKILTKIFESNEPVDNSLQAKKHLQVQVLKHWCMMNGCIYKSIKAPPLKEIVENNELLHHFIGYMNSINSIAILQLYLSLSKIEFYQENIWLKCVWYNPLLFYYIFYYLNISKLKEN